MTTKNELALLVDELHRCGDALSGILGRVDDLLSGFEEKPLLPKVSSKKKSVAVDKPESQLKAEKVLALETVRAACADKARQGFTAEIKAILTKYGAGKLSEVDPAKYKTLLNEVEALGNVD